MDDLYAKLLESSIRFVSFRPRSEKEFKDFLLKILQKRKASDDRMIDRVLTRLRDLGYADDAKFVSWWINQRQSHKPKGVRAIAQELKAKGVSDDLVKSLVVKRRDQFSCDRNGIGTDDELSLAKRAVEKKLPLWQKLPPLERKKKIYGFLGRRGFTGDTTRRIIDEVVRGEVESSEHD